MPTYKHHGGLNTLRCILLTKQRKWMEEIQKHYHFASLLEKNIFNELCSLELSSFFLPLFIFHYRLYCNYFKRPFTGKFIARKASSWASTNFQRDNWRNLVEHFVTVLWKAPNTISHGFTHFFIPSVRNQNTYAAELTLSFTENLCRSTPSVNAWLSGSPDWLKGTKEVCHFGPFGRTELCLKLRWHHKILLRPLKES